MGHVCSWACADVLHNVHRALLAEFLVAAALDLLGELRVAWDAVDLRYRCAAYPRGAGIEVKSAAYLQSWPQETYSVISDGSAKARLGRADGRDGTRARAQRRLFGRG